MNWFKIANHQAIVDKIKNILKTNKLTLRLLSYYKIPVSDIDNHLQIEIRDLDSKFAEGNSSTIFLDKKLFDGNFFEDNFHFVIHEFYHWIKRRSEKDFYFNDPEEVQSFVLAITWQLLHGKCEDYIRHTIYPIVQAHFKDEEKAQKLFRDMLLEAQRLSNL
jgi:hypothetical protein